MTVPGPPTVREILVQGILWWVQGRKHFPPHRDLAAAFTTAQLDEWYDLVVETEQEVGQSRLEWVMEHLAQDGGAYMTADGQIVEANRPAGAPDIPAALLDKARELYASAVRAA